MSNWSCSRLLCGWKPQTKMWLWCQCFTITNSWNSTTTDHMWPSNLGNILAKITLKIKVANFHKKKRYAQKYIYLITYYNEIWIKMILCIHYIWLMEMIWVIQISKVQFNYKQCTFDNKKGESKRKKRIEVGKINLKMRLKQLSWERRCHGEEGWVDTET